MSSTQAETMTQSVSLSASSKRNSNNHNRARVVLVGTGVMGKIRASKMFANPRFEIAGICDGFNFAKAEELASMYSTKAFHSLDEAVALLGVREKQLPEPTVTGMGRLVVDEDTNNDHHGPQARRPSGSSSDTSSVSSPSSDSPVPSVVSANSTCSRASSFTNNAKTGIDGVVISVRTEFHSQYIQAAARHGLAAIFVEKPVAETPKEIEDLFATCQESNTKLCCGFQRRFDESYVAAARAIRSGQIGQALSAHVFFGDSPCPPLDFLLSGGDIFSDLSVHDVDFIRWALQDDIENVYATATFSSPELEKHGVHDNATMVMKFTKGTIVTLTLSRWSCYGYDQRCEIFGERGMVSVRNEYANTTVVADQDGEHRSRLKNSFPQRYHNAFANELDAFADTILLSTPWDVTKQDVIAVQKVAQAAKQACVTKTALDVDITTDGCDVEQDVIAVQKVAAQTAAKKAYESKTTLDVGTSGCCDVTAP